jgi:uncharacterized protein (TIGR02646 family)
LPVKAAEEALKQMAGGRERCMYCLDSHGTDIEHFWPKSPYPEKMYYWPNMLLCCTDCGRIKGDRFPIDQSKKPLLVDPTAENPWDFIDFDPDTGNLTARFDLLADAYSLKGAETVRVLELDRREALAAGYRKTYKRLKAIIERHILEESFDSLPNELIEEDDHGLLWWGFKAAGQNEAPFKTLRDSHPTAWLMCLAAID